MQEGCAIEKRIVITELVAILFSMDINLIGVITERNALNSLTFQTGSFIMLIRVDMRSEI